MFARCTQLSYFLLGQSLGSKFYQHIDEAVTFIMVISQRQRETILDTRT